MNFLSFEYFLALRQAGTIRRAAEALYISPQALSDHLRKLEREVGTALFLRTTPLTLTAAGERFAQMAQECLDARKRFGIQLTEIRQREERLISLGVPTGMPPPMLLAFATYFRRVHPEFTLTITELPSRSGALADLPDHIDLAMGAFPEGKRLIHIPVVSSRHFVVAAHGDLLRRVLGAAAAVQIERSAEAGVPVELDRFRGCPFVLKRAGSIVRENEDRIFQKANITPQGEMETGDLELSIQLALLGEAAVYLPEPVARAGFLIPELSVQACPVLLCPVRAEGEEWALTAAHAADRPLSRGAGLLVEEARRYYSEWMRQWERTDHLSEAESPGSPL